MSVDKVKDDHNDDYEHHHENAYEVVKLCDMMYDEVEQLYQYQCPCGDLFEILLEDLYDGEDIALCPSCTLKLKVIYTQDELPELMEYSSSDDDYDEEEEEQEVKENVKEIATKQKMVEKKIAEAESTSVVQTSDVST